MTGLSAVRRVMSAPEDVSPMPEGPSGPPRRPPSEGRPDPTELPPGFPVVPLGHADGVYHFLTGRGELASYSAGAMSQRANLFALFAGAPYADQWLAWIGPPGPRDTGFSPVKASDLLASACACLPLFDTAMQVRRRGTWRGPDGRPVAHLGDRIAVAQGVPREAGAWLGGAVYPACAAGPGPAPTACDPGDLRGLRDDLAAMWAWDNPGGADVLMGWIGQAVLGQFPTWRTHLWVEGKRGSGKTTLVEIASDLLGGMSTGVRKGSSEAAVRQTTNQMAVARVFDEAETTGEAGHVEAIIGLFRLMSDASGATVERGSMGGQAQTYRLYGAGLFASIQPGLMRPQDRSRFVMLKVSERPASLDPIAESARLADLEGSAEFYGPYVWRRMLDEAGPRWDAAFGRYSALVQSLGGDRRSGDTIGAILAGWDLMLHEGPVTDDRLHRAAELARPLLQDVELSESESEGERCLRHLLAGLLNKDHGGMTPVHELVEDLLDMSADPDNSHSAQRLLARAGLRVLEGERGKRKLFVQNGGHPQLDKFFANTPWRGGGHRTALLTLPEVEPSPVTVRVAGRKARGIVIASTHLPGSKND